jgi:hypothetical protein
LTERESLGQRLARELDEYLVDLRELRADLKSIEGWIALGLMILAILMTAGWVFVSLGFNPDNEHVSALMYKFGLHACRPLSNFNGVILFIDFFLVLFMSVITLGNVFNMMQRVSHGYPREPRDLIISAALMLASGLGGIIFMLQIC